MTFDHRDAGTDEAGWEAAGVAGLPALTPRAWAPGDTLLVAVAHPDDETLGAAGLIRAALRGPRDQAKLMTACLVVTDEAGDVVLEFPFAEAVELPPSEDLTRH